MARLLIAISVALATASAATAMGNAPNATTSFNCPKNPSTKGMTAWVRNYSGYRGSTWCNDGAVVNVTVGAKPLTFAGGLCTKSRNGQHVQVGTHVSPDSKRKPSDPPGFILQKANPGLEDSISIGMSKVKWWESGDDVKVAWSKSALKGTFSGTAGQWINNKYTLVKATGSFRCNRIVNAIF